jgi:hypothetical protein
MVTFFSSAQGLMSGGIRLFTYACGLWFQPLFYHERADGICRGEHSNAIG